MSWLNDTLPVLDARERQIYQGFSHCKKVPPPRVADSERRWPLPHAPQVLAHRMLTVAAEGFARLQAQAARFTPGEMEILHAVNRCSAGRKASRISEICTLRSYVVSRAVRQSRREHLWGAFAQGGGTGIFGLAGLPFHLVLSLFLSFRAVETVALYYGYESRRSSAELAFAGQVFLASLCGGTTAVHAFLHAPVENSPEKLAALRVQADATARSLGDAGTKSVERMVFQETLEQLVRRFLLRDLGRLVPVISAAIGAILELQQMDTVLTFADRVYQKRFLCEKEMRIMALQSHQQKALRL